MSHAAVAEDEREAPRGSRQVHGHVGGAGLQDAVQRGERGARLGQTERHPIPALDPGTAQPLRDPVALFGQPSVGEPIATDDERRRLGAAGGRSVEQLVDELDHR